jgi:hypothetical protein
MRQLKLRPIDLSRSTRTRASVMRNSVGHVSVILFAVAILGRVLN